MRTSRRFNKQQINDYLLHRQHLAVPAQNPDLARTVEEIGGLHATAVGVPYLSLWARRTTFTKRELQEALFVERSLGKVLCMRNTLFILPREMLPVAYQATKKQREALLNRWLRHNGISRQEYEGSTATIREALGKATKTSAEIKRELDDPTLTAVVDLMPNDWQLIRGPVRGTWRSNLHEYSAFDAWFPDVNLGSLAPGEAKVKLVRYYLSHLGPATEQDMVWWTGLGKREIKDTLTALGQHLVELEIEGLGGGYLILRGEVAGLERHHQKGRSTMLLPRLDPYVMAYKDRRRFLDQARYDQVHDRAGNALPTVWLDGEVIGVWLENRDRSMLEVFLFQEIDVRVAANLEAEAQRLACFLEHDPVRVQIGPYPGGAYPKSPFTLAQKL